MPVPTLISQLSTTASLNSPDGAVDVPSSIDDYQRAHAAFIAQLRDRTATDLPNTPAGNIAATTVQAAINELDNEKAKVGANADITSLNAVTAINGGGFGLRNWLPNSSARVAQRFDAGLTINLTTSRLVGGVDACALWASGGAVSAGTITQLKTSIAGTTGYAARAAGVTLTGSGVISHAVRMKSSDARSYKNKTASFQISVAHDVGSNINYTVILKKATAEDNWTSMTTIATSGATSVPTATGTIVKFENQALGDVSNGMEIEVQAACGAVTTKNFDFTEWSLDIGSVAPTFNGNSYEIDEAECLTYLPGWVSNGGSTTQTVGWAYTNSTTSAIGGIEFSGAKARITPTGILAATASRFTFATNGTTFVGSAIAFSAANRSKGTVNLTVSGATGGQGGQIYCNNIPGYIFFTGAELF